MHARRIYSGFIKAEQENPSASTIPRALPIYAGLFRQPPNVANRIRLRRAASNAHIFNKISYAGLSKRSQRGGLENLSVNRTKKAETP